MSARENSSNRIKKNSSYRKLVEEFQALSNQILQFANRGALRPYFQQEVSKMILEFSGCERVELWLRDHGKYFRCKANRNGSLISFHLSLGIQDKRGEFVPDSDDDPNLIHLCRDILLNRADLSQPGFRRNGSFWAGNAEGLLGSSSEEDKKSHGQSLDIIDDYRSLALMPLRVDHENIGLLQLKSKRRDYFTKDKIELYEGLARSLGIALAHRHAQVDLRERIKELTCLYGMARLTSGPDKPLEEILQGIDDLLPPAWLYPGIASARIHLDGLSYSTSPFREGRHRQRQDIVVNEERRGYVEVIYSEERPELDEGPFMKEERSLLETVAKEVALIIIRKRSEEDKMKLENQLRHADRLATIGQLSAGVAHELNEPLGNILGFAQLAKKCPGLPKQAELDIEKILTASLNAREVVKKLLIFARKLPPRKTKVNLNLLVEEGLNFFESRCANEGIKLLRSLSPDLPEIPADPAQLNQVMVNLIINALQAMKTGGRLTIGTLAGKEHISLIVEDTGIGMDEEVMKQIFTPFFTTKDVGQGTGLGLPVVHGIVTSHGGSIKVESKLNQGSRFEIQLPVTGSPEVEVGK